MDQSRVLKVTQYDIEIWDWHTNKYVADISNIVTDGINMTWVLNDVETLDFDIDLIQFEKKCAEMGATPGEVLTPYVHDIRIRRNGEYILGCQVVETNIQIQNNSNPKIQVKCTGFLNCFKDQYISEPMKGYTYPQMAHKLVNRAQHADVLIKNPTIDIDASYWMSDNGAVAYITSTRKAGAGALQVTRSGTGWNTCGIEMKVPAGTQIKVDAWVSGQSGVAISFLERQLVTSSTGQVSIGSVTPSSNNTWTHFTSSTYTTQYDNGYLYIQQNRTNASYNLRVDNCFVYRVDDQDSLHDLKIGSIYAGLDDTTGGTGHNYATSGFTSDREYAYELQNVKDAIMELTALEDDNFDFEFTYDRKFNTYDRKGTDKVDIEAVYPGNIHSMNIKRSAANLANKIINIGSGIGDERIEYTATDTTSRQNYGTRESVITNNNVSIVEMLEAQAEGKLYDLKDPTDLPTVVIRDGSINPGNVQVGDGIIVKVDNGDNYLNTINGLYRIMQMQVQTDLENIETVTLTLEA